MLARTFGITAPFWFGFIGSALLVQSFQRLRNVDAGYDTAGTVVVLAPEDCDHSDAVRVVDGWAFSDAWLEETTAAVEARLRDRAERSPLDPGVALAELLPSEPWAASVLGLLPVERRGPKAYLPGAAATLGSRAGAERVGARRGRPVNDAALRRSGEHDRAAVLLGEQRHPGGAGVLDHGEGACS